MSLVLNEEQVFLKDSAKKFASEKTPTTHFREVRDSEIAISLSLTSRK